MTLNLIIDGNYILSRLVFSLHKNNLLYGALYSALENTISNYRKLYPFSNIYIVSDSKQKSWRKSLNKNYKSTRKKDSDIDWNFVYETYSQFKKDVKIKVFESQSTEGDDWISFLISESNSKFQSNMVISNDYDIKQLLKYDINNLYINFMSNEIYSKSRIFLPIGWKLFLSKIKNLPNDDIFNLNDNKDFIELIENLSQKYDLVEVDSTQSVILKLISGDVSDNIDSAWQTKDKSGRNRGIGIKGAQSILDRYSLEFGLLSLKDPDLFENLADLICEKKKLPKSSIADIIKRIEENSKIINLELENFPSEILNNMREIYMKYTLSNE
jgi:5'-3' exonuclease